MTAKTCTAKLSKTAREAGLYSRQSIIVKYRPFTSTRPPSFTAYTTGAPERKHRVTLGKIPNGLKTLESQAAYVAAQLAETLHWPLTTYRIAHADFNTWAFVGSEAPTIAFTTKPL